ncbi:hypothetical protein SNEBB_000463 [Seison nebaliae]|nr:hypothetical protein SNEBB_000463 [Seison nebaliae]
MTFKKILGEVLNEYPLNDIPGKVRSYGTAGFRANSKYLDPIVAWTTCFMSLESQTHPNDAMGIIVTASHNPVEDNGIKIVDIDGGMLNLKSESNLDEFIKITSIDKSLDFLWKTYPDQLDGKGKSLVIIGGDTRPSTQRFLGIIEKIFKRLTISFINIGEVTTPKLHYGVMRINEKIPVEKVKNIYKEDFVENTVKLLNVLQLNNKNHQNKLFIDAANGIGGPTVKRLLDDINDKFEKIDGNFKFNYELIDDTRQSSDCCTTLNVDCGADFVKTQQTFPSGLFSSKLSPPYQINDRCCSFDGDADRIIYSYKSENDKFILLDGDKILIIFAKTLNRWLKEAELKDQLTFRCIQTGYANGASTKYLNEKENIGTSLTKTGVKYLHREGMKYDISIYFEANGHGTILFSQKFYEKVSEKNVEMIKKKEVKESRTLLRLFSNIINRSIGDAITNMICVEILLQYHYPSNSSRHSAVAWSEIYLDNYFHLSKLIVKDRYAIKTSENELKIIGPIQIQELIDKIIENHNMVNKDSCRSFVRPSGTEDAVRIYAESIISYLKAKELSEEIEKIVKENF